MKVDNDKKIKIYKLLGAEKFQKVVFKVEDIKYKIIDKIPNFIKWYDKYCDNVYSAKIKLTKDNNKRLELVEKCKLEKMVIRKEINYKKNRNYHYNKKYPTRFIEYLNLNKRIHQKGLICNGVILTGILIYMLTPLPKSLLVISLISGYQLISAFINFECINLQNYNLCRFNEERIKEKLENSEKRNIDRRIKENISVVKPIYDVVKQENDVPMVDDILDSITTKDQVTALLKYTRSQIIEMKNSKASSEINKQYKLGGK